ncbi:glycoprotein [Sanxia Water Strider Virus 5]|uniref:glycoprotein n=1 Tax=Sanxia Water Strider Virus 5 TaxID=1608064 RepID=UPI0005AD4206|nr:glycoprotein [Sanxia Water Strider Virus 5]AJG39119.1 glycoprotein [Sanxia Water Strider Virus 5]
MLAITTLLFLLHFTTSDPAVDLRLKFFADSTIPHVLKVPHIRSCPHYATMHPDNPDLSIPTSATIYRVVESGEPSFGYLLTAYQLTIECGRGFWGFPTSHLLHDNPTDLDLIPGNLLSAFITRTQPLVSQRKTLQSLIETFDQDLTECPWLSTSKKTSFVLRLKQITPVWSIDGHLLQPLNTHNCTLTTEDPCRLGKSSLLLRASSQQASCSMTTLMDLDGVLSIHAEASTYSLQFSALDIDFSLSIKQDHLVVLCSSTTQLIFNSEEGHIFSIATHGGRSAMFNLLSRYDNKTYYDYKKWLEVTTNKRYKRSTLSSSQFKLISFPSIVSPDHENDQYNHSRRLRRSTIFDYPEYQRLQVLEERLAWGFSELGAVTNRFHSSGVKSALVSKTQNCIQDVWIKRLLELAPNPWLIAAYFTRDSSIITAGRTSLGPIILQGSPVSKIFLPNRGEEVWCNSSIRVNFSLPDGSMEQQGWLESGYGRLFPLTRPCGKSQPLLEFYIPSYEKGDYELMSRSYPDMAISEPEEKMFRFSFVDFTPDSGLHRLHYLERIQSYAGEDTESNKDWTSYARMFADPTGASHSILSSYVVNLLTPFVILFLSLYTILFCVSICRRSTESLFKARSY